MKVLTDRLPDDTAFDVVVVGAGGAGLAAALFAAIDGAKVLLVEHTAFVGGTTALSAGTTWVPGTTHATEVSGNDTVERASGYLDRTVGRQSPKAMRAALLANGPAAVAHAEANSSVAWRACAKHPDYLSEVEGSTLAGRALEPLPFDGRLLGDLFPLVRPPIPEFTVLGGMMVDRTDIHHLLSITRSWKSFRHATRLLLRHGLDRLSHPRGTRLVMGNALVARFLHSLSARANVTLALSTSVDALHREGDRIAAVPWCSRAVASTAIRSAAPNCCRGRTRPGAPAPRATPVRPRTSRWPRARASAPPVRPTRSGPRCRCASGPTAPPPCSRIS